MKEKTKVYQAWPNIYKSLVRKVARNISTKWKVNPAGFHHILKNVIWKMLVVTQYHQSIFFLIISNTF